MLKLSSVFNRVEESVPGYLLNIKAALFFLILYIFYIKNLSRSCRDGSISKEPADSAQGPE